MPITRREFLKTGATAATLAAAVSVPRPLLAHLGATTAEEMPAIDDPRLRALAARALDSARSAGAIYADVRLTHTRTRTIGPDSISDTESMVAGVRSLVQGYWGFASSPVWSPDEMARLGREAVHQAKVNALGESRVVELAPAPAVPEGHWVMPVKMDPFDVPVAEIQDFLVGLILYTGRTPGAAVGSNYCTFVVQEKAFGSTEGSYCTQRLYTSSGSLEIQLSNGKEKETLWVDLLTPTGVGWELYRDQPLREAIRRVIEELEEDLKLPVKPVDVGRYDAAFDAWSVANLQHETLAPATELDRALGYEANAGGTSYINQPFEMLGSYQVGAPSITVRANRSEPGGAATVRWDDEGVAPDEFTLVKDGVLADFQTMRESAGWLKDYYAKVGEPVHSHGCAAAPEGLDVPLTHAPNLTLASGPEALDFDTIVAGMTKGIAIKDVSLDMDFQHLNGLATGRFYEVRNGKRVARIGGAGTLFRAPELWKGLLALGGQASARRFGMWSSKGEPAQAHVASVTAVPAMFKQLTLIDPQRKA